MKLHAKDDKLRLNRCVNPMILMIYQSLGSYNTEPFKLCSSQEYYALILEPAKRYYPVNKNC